MYVRPFQSRPPQCGSNEIYHVAQDSSLLAQALIKTNMPSPRSLNSVQSADHGLLLWCPIDGGRTRIGYVFSEKLQRKWGTVDGQNVSEEAIMEEARKAVEPFTLEFEKVDWFTIYVGITVQ